MHSKGPLFSKREERGIETQCSQCFFWCRCEAILAEDARFPSTWMGRSGGGGFPFLLGQAVSPGLGHAA